MSFVDQATALDETACRILAETDFASQAEFNVRRARKIGYAMTSLGIDGILAGTSVLELGPGHYAFALLARALGAQVTCFEADPAFVRLGEHLGFRMRVGDFYSQLGKEDDRNAYRGIWVKGSFNACRLQTPTRIENFAQRLDACLEPGGWGFLVPVNKVGADSGSARVQECIGTQKEIMVALGWSAVQLPENLRRAMALHYAGNPFIFLKNLEFSIQPPSGSRP